MAKARYQRWCAAFDNHGSEQDETAVRAFFEFVEWFKPTIRIHGGDCFNVSALRKGASDEEKREPIRDDIDAGLNFIGKYKPTIFLRGNHDERIWDACESDDGKLADFAGYLLTDIKEALKDAQVYPYDKRAGVLKLGHLKLIHGYHSGITAARMAAQIYGSVVMGHIHAVDQFSIPGLERRIGRSAGCLCNLSMKYNRAQANTLRQSHGFAYGLLLPNGEYVYWQAEKVGGKWFLPSEWREVSGAKKD